MTHKETITALIPLTLLGILGTGNAQEVGFKEGGIAR